MRCAPQHRCWKESGCQTAVPQYVRKQYITFQLFTNHSTAASQGLLGTQPFHQNCICLPCLPPRLSCMHSPFCKALTPLWCPTQRLPRRWEPQTLQRLPQRRDPRLQDASCCSAAEGAVAAALTSSTTGRLRTPRAPSVLLLLGGPLPALPLLQAA